ncbi:class E sortase [Cellulomonas alba]|uniref:Class E sortase n=1 Tax=Cellulomonas alba TaxID=3053467 RepID=A0ABT7SFV7_9CELL|nr:class E sortase [Cellulomonas alba]MDM7855065.1 class E sortase [Cellulomonas alba]
MSAPEHAGVPVDPQGAARVEPAAPGSPAPGDERGAPSVKARPSRAHSIVFGTVGVIGELLITAGVLLFGFLAWQLWWTDVQGDKAQAQIVDDFATDPVPTTTPTVAGEAARVKIATPRHDEPPVDKAPAHAVTFATVQVPRWHGIGAKPISEGIDRATVLNPKGVGHYPGTQMPGDVGNFATAGHRTTYGKPYHRIAELKVGDPIVIRTKTTWYVYRMVSKEIVYPNDVGVIAPVPDQPGKKPTKRMITMTSCTPMYSAAQRYVVHGELDYWAPISSGIPVELLGTKGNPSLADAGLTSMPTSTSTLGGR